MAFGDAVWRRRTMPAIAILAVAAVIALWIVLATAPRPATTSRRAAPMPVIAAPRVEPQVFAAVTPDDARASNARVPVIAGAIEAARPFAYAGSALDRSRALACLAAAAYYEAGDLPAGERAVAQVVLNRVRHPAFPKSVCGVVFQGSERTTGCQFTFTCDGAMRRMPSAAAWDRARTIADKALSGSVYKGVGTATHYHADWVVPYWRPTLDKIAAVEGQDFYRWKGRWGSRGAFSAHGGGPEALNPQLALLAGEAIDPLTGEAVVDAQDGTKPSSVTVAGVSRAALGGAVVRAADTAAGQFVLELDRGGGASGQLAAAKALCRGRTDCLVMGWLHAELMPLSLPVMPVRMRSMAFMYRRSAVLAVDRPYWNCRQAPGHAVAECLPGTEP